MVKESQKIIWNTIKKLEKELDKVVKKIGEYEETISQLKRLERNLRRDLKSFQTLSPESKKEDVTQQK